MYLVPGAWPAIIARVFAATNTYLQHQLPTLGKRCKGLQRDLAEVKCEQDRLLSNWDELKATEARALLATEMNGLVDHQRQIEDAIAEVDAAISRVQATRIDATVVRNALAHISEIYSHLQPHEQKELFGMIVRRAEVTANEIRLELHSEALGGGAEGLDARDASGVLVKSRFEIPHRLPESDPNQGLLG